MRRAPVFSSWLSPRGSSRLPSAGCSSSLRLHPCPRLPRRSSPAACTRRAPNGTAKTGVSKKRWAGAQQVKPTEFTCVGAPGGRSRAARPAHLVVVETSRDRGRTMWRTEENRVPFPGRRHDRVRRRRKLNRSLNSHFVHPRGAVVWFRVAEVHYKPVCALAWVCVGAVLPGVHSQQSAGRGYFTPFSQTSFAPPPCFQVGFLPPACVIVFTTAQRGREQWLSFLLGLSK